MKNFILGSFLLLTACQNGLHKEVPNSLMAFTFRMGPGEDLKVGLQNYARSKKLRASSVVTAVGSLKKARLRLADKNEASDFTGPFEIVSLVGTVSTQGSHLHLAVSDSNGKTTGGHLVEGNLIYTTCEITLLEDQNVDFNREHDPHTGFPELKVQTRSKKP